MFLFNTYIFILNAYSLHTSQSSSSPASHLTRPTNLSISQSNTSYWHSLLSVNLITSLSQLSISVLLYPFSTISLLLPLSLLSLLFAQTPNYSYIYNWHIIIINSLFFPSCPPRPLSYIKSYNLRSIPA